MANRMKEDERNEKIIRGLLKLPENRRCINCNNLGPQYVCTNFWTFICTNCSGLHREFTHRVKSISMAKFTAQEVAALQEGGNKRAREIYFKEWDSQRHSLPDGSNIDKLRDFIKHVYVDRKYTGEKISDRHPGVKGDREVSNEGRRGDSYRGGSRSPPYDDRFRYVYGERSPGYDQGDRRRSPRHFEVVDDRQRDDRYGNRNQNRRFEDHKLVEGVKKLDGSSPNHQKDINASSLPMIRPVRDILGEETPPLRVGDPPKANGTRVPDNSSQTQRTSSSSSLGSSDGNAAQRKRANSESLIDFAAEPEPPVAVASQQSVPQQTTSPSAITGDWASFDAAKHGGTQVAGSANTLESTLAQLSAPAGNASDLPVSVVDSLPKTDNGAELPTLQRYQPSLNPVTSSQSTNQQFTAPAVAAIGNQSRGSPLAPYMQGPLTAAAGHASQDATKPFQEMSATQVSQEMSGRGSVEAKPSGRQALPEDLFTSIYPSASMSVLSWQRGPHPSMVYSMQYPMGVTMPTFPQSTKSANPFDTINEPAIAHATSFPSLASLQGALLNVSGPSPLLRSSSFGAPSTQWIPPQQSSYQLAISPSPYMMQQVPSNMPQQLPTNMASIIHQRAGDPFIEGAVSGIPGMDQFSAARYSYSQPSTPNSFGSVGGNPFG